MKKYPVKGANARARCNSTSPRPGCSTSARLKEWLDLFADDVLYFMPPREIVLRRV
jgi:hypothetical protein